MDAEMIMNGVAEAAADMMGDAEGGAADVSGAEESRSFEENLALLQETVEVLENEDIALEDAFKKYEQGMKLLKECNNQIDRVEKQVMMLTGSKDAVPFEE